jgi:hypothetical protein
MDDLRPAITYELGFQMKRGLMRLLKASYGLPIAADEVSFDGLAEAGVYFLGDPDSVARQLREILRRRWRLRDAAAGDRQGLGHPRETRAVDEAVHATRGPEAQGARAVT